MARATKKAKEEEPQQTGVCRDCAHSYDHHDVGANGTYIFGRCPYYKFCRLLNWHTCQNFTPRKRNG